MLAGNNWAFGLWTTLATSPRTNTCLHYSPGSCLADLIFDSGVQQLWLATCMIMRWNTWPFGRSLT